MEIISIIMMLTGALLLALLEGLLCLSREPVRVTVRASHCD
jgi:hypothetical protein